jgi:hypothetical protein
MIFRSALAMLTLAAVVPAGAQEARLQARMDASTYSSVRAIIDSAKRVGLPTGPIEDKALEGASAGATGPAIVTAVRAFSAKLAEASRALGRKATLDELRAGVGAIESGLPSRDLMRLRNSAGGRTVATALAVTTDLVIRTVPVHTASNLMISLLRAHVKDADIMEFDRMVRMDITNGANPADAAAARARGAITIAGSSKS